MLRIVSFALLALGAALPCAAQYPDRPLTLLAGFPAGGLVDIVSRVVAEGMEPRVPQGIVVVNKSGAGGSVAVSELVQARPNPGKLRVGTPGEGTASHLNLEELIFRSGAKLTPVPYAGWGQSSPALLGKHIEAVVAQPGEAKPLVDGRRMRALVMFQRSRHAAFPDTPTAKEAGWDVANGVWYLLVAPKGTPAPALTYLHDAAKAVMDDPSFKTIMTARGVDVDYRAGEPLRADLWREYKLDSEILRRIGLIKQ